ncbi:hypothetical protein FE257_003132 [Aspergillus nanangensis]|uniref:Uncharacterized protein n=1 Tax=Aspergillus nanangensis TaxID=2582783 RepID=A0AAD4CBX5_ASPNN|nr:hypothetical protein FE257_003132 [Aspergillus nanangensis]
MGIYLNSPLTPPCCNDDFGHYDLTDDIKVKSEAFSGLSFTQTTQEQTNWPVTLGSVKARQIVRTLVQVALELLSDEDEGKDVEVEAYGKLLLIFITLGDEKNAFTALAMMALERRVDHGNSLQYDMNTPCTGRCGHVWKFSNEISVCKDCITWFLEKDCLKRLRDGALQIESCNPNHDFLGFPKWDGGRMEWLRKGVVPWGEQNMTWEE